MRFARSRLRVEVAALSLAAMALSSRSHAAPPPASVEGPWSPATDAPTAMPVVIVSSSTAVVGTGLTVAGIVQADTNQHPVLVGAGVGAVLVSVPAMIASLAADEPSAMEDPALAAAGVGTMALGAGALGTGVIAFGGAGDEVAGPALLVAGGVTLTGGIVLTALGVRDEPERAAEQERLHPTPMLAPGERSTAGDLGLGLTVTGLTLVAGGGATAAGGAAMDDRLTGTGVMIGGGGVASLGLVMATVGGVLLSTGTGRSPAVSVGPGSVDVRGSF